jgi:hypothetical protein
MYTYLTLCARILSWYEFHISLQFDFEATGQVVLSVPSEDPEDYCPKEFRNEERLNSRKSCRHVARELGMTG